MRLTLALVAVLLLVTAGTAQTPAPSTPAAKPPELSEVQRLKIQTLAQRIELAQLRYQMAQKDFDAAREELQTMVKGLQVDGYTLDLQNFIYTKNPPATAPTKKDN